MLAYIFFWILLLVVLIWIIILIVWLKKKTQKLSKEKIDFYKKEIKKCKYVSLNEKFIYYDKILNHVLTDLWYIWSLWEQLKQNPKEIKNIQEIWRLHKIRNRISHELWLISNFSLTKECNNFEKEINKLLEI